MPATAALPRDIPIFPLPNVVLFPDVYLPLHIFEPRYRNMVRDALAGDRIIGMVLLRDGRSDEATPPVYPIGCAGAITHAARLPDGRYNIVLRGVEKFRVRAEVSRNSYRLASVDALPERPDPDERTRLRSGRRRMEALLDRRLREVGSESGVPREMSDEHLVNALAQYLEFEPVEKQLLLERDGVAARCESLIGLLEMRRATAGSPHPRPRVQ